MRLKLLNDMMIFVKVVDNSSFTAAADKLGISKSVVSKHIARLEKTLSAQLLQRSTRSLTLTEAGRSLYERCLSISRDVEEAELAVSYTQEKPRGTLRVTSAVSFGHQHLASAIADFLVLHPEMNVEMLLSNYYEDMIGHGLDLSIRVGELEDSSLIARRLAVLCMRVCASPTYLKKHGTPKHPQDLLEHNCLLYEGSPTGKEWHFEHNKETIRIPIKYNFASNSSQALEQAAAAGLGIAYLPGYMMTQDVKNGNLITLLEDYCPPNIPIHAVYPHTRHLAPKVRVFIDFLVERYQANTYWAFED